MAKVKPMLTMSRARRHRLKVRLAIYCSHFGMPTEGVREPGGHVLLLEAQSRHYDATPDRRITMRHGTILFSLVAAWVLFAATPFAAADIVRDLTVKIDFQTCNYTLCMFNDGFIPDGDPSGGYASFTQLALPWSYAFVTPPPYLWCTNCPWWYDAQFDQGGTFTMTGPHG